MSHPKLPPMFGDEVLGAEVPVAAMSSPKIPPLQGDGVTSATPPRPVGALCTAVEFAARIHFKTPWFYQD